VAPPGDALGRARGPHRRDGATWWGSRRPSGTYSCGRSRPASWRRS